MAEREREREREREKERERIGAVGKTEGLAEIKRGVAGKKRLGMVIFPMMVTVCRLICRLNFDRVEYTICQVEH